MKKISLLDKRILTSVRSCFLFVGTLLGIIALFKQDIVETNRIFILSIYVCFLVIYYVYIIITSNKLKKVVLKIHNSIFEIKEGDIFKEKALKVVNFNEYFDTIVDDKIIAHNSLNGCFIDNYIESIDELDKNIKSSASENVIETNQIRKIGKIDKYPLGTIACHKDYLLTAFTKFSDINRAELTLKDYLQFLMNFWDNLDKVYANRDVAITLFGSNSLTRFKDTNDISDQDLIEIIIWTFKVSKIKFKYPRKISLILSRDLLNRINLYEVKEMYKNGI